jgi:hypothetical protein
MTTAPALQLRFDVVVTISQPIDLGVTQRGHRRVIPITGGSFTYFGNNGEQIRGAVLPIGADFQTLLTNELTHLSASYVLEDAEGQRILVENSGIRHADSQTISAINRGESVPPESVYFTTTPVLSSSDERYAWVTSRVFVAKAIRTPDRVTLSFFEVE